MRLRVIERGEADGRVAYRLHTETAHSFIALAPINGNQERVRFHGTTNLRNGTVSTVMKRGSALADGVKFFVSGDAELNIGGAYYSRVNDPYEYTRAVAQALLALDALNVVRPNGGLKESWAVSSAKV